MKKIISILLSAAAVISLASCNKSDNPSSDSFGCTIKVTPSENSAVVAVEVNDANAEYQLWVVESASYAEKVPVDARTLKGNASETFTGLKSDTEYTAVVYEASAGFKAKEFVTDKSTVTYESLQGSEYIIIAMDETTSNSIASKTKYLMYADGNYGATPYTGTIFFDYWNGGAAGTCSGPNSYGVVSDWFSVIPPAGWFGFCFRLEDDEKNLSTDAEKEEAAKRRAALKSITSDYTLHLAMKANCAGEYSLRCLSGEFGVTIGDENATYGFKRDGQWHEIEIPMSVFMASDKYNASTESGIIAFTQGTNGYPTTLDFDAVFFYKK